MRRVKMRAVQRQRRLKETIAGRPKTGMAIAPSGAPPTRPPKPVQLKKHRPQTIDDIESAIAAGRD